MYKKMHAWLTKFSVLARNFRETHTFWDGEGYVRTSGFWL